MHIVSSGFGVIALLIMIKGFFDIKKKIKEKPFFDHVIESVDTLRHVQTGSNRWVLLRGSELKYSSFDPSTVYVKGIVFFRVKKPVTVITEGGKVLIKRGKGMLETGRFQNIFLSEGYLNYNQYVLSGKNVYFNEQKKFDTVLSGLPGEIFPVIIHYDSDNSDSLKWKQKGFRILHARKGQGIFYWKPVE